MISGAYIWYMIYLYLSVSWVLWGHNICHLIYWQLMFQIWLPRRVSAFSFTSPNVSSGSATWTKLLLRTYMLRRLVCFHQPQPRLKVQRLFSFFVFSTYSEPSCTWFPIAPHKAIDLSLMWTPAPCVGSKVYVRDDSWGAFCRGTWREKRGKTCRAIVCS